MIIHFVREFGRLLIPPASGESLPFPSFSLGALTRLPKISRKSYWYPY